MCSSKICLLKPNPHNKDVWRWGLGSQLGHKGGVLINRISALIRGDRRDMTFFHHVTTQQEGSHLQTRTRALPGTELASILILNFSTSRTVRNECFLTYTVNSILLQQLERA